MTPDQHDLFARALFDPDLPVPATVRERDPDGRSTRFNVHRNTVVSGLIDVLAARFPVVRRIVGEEYFAALARVFVTTHPPRSPVILSYGGEFPTFLEAFPPLADLAYLPDVARLEVAMGRAQHAADTEPVGADVFTAMSPMQLEGLRIDLHPSASIICSPHPALTIWEKNRPDRESTPVEGWSPEDVVVARPDLEVLAWRLPAGGASLLQALGSGMTLGDAAASTCLEPGFDLTAILAVVFSAGLAAGFRNAPSP